MSKPSASTIKGFGAWLPLWGFAFGLLLSLTGLWSGWERAFQDLLLRSRVAAMPAPLSPRVFPVDLNDSAERNLGRQYVNNHKGDAIMLSPCNFLYKENPGAYVDLSRFPKPQQQDSVAYFNSSYMQFVSDSVFLTLFTNSLIDELSSLGYDVVLDQSADLFLNSSITSL